MDKREIKSEGGLSSSNTPTVTSWRFPHRIKDTLVDLAGKWINERDARNGTKNTHKR